MTVGHDVVLWLIMSVLSCGAAYCLGTYHGSR